MPVWLKNIPDNYTAQLAIMGWFLTLTSKMTGYTIPGVGVAPRRASLSVRITDKNGDHAEAGKIWENQFFTRKMNHHIPKCTQIDEGTCQGVI